MAAQSLPAAAEKRKSPGPWKMLWVMAALAGIGGAIGYRFGDGWSRAGFGVRPNLWSLLAIPIVALLPLALHEAGHIWGGLSAGFRFYMYLAGPLRIERDGDRLRFGFNRIAALWGGAACCVPQAFDKDLRRKMMRFTLGGPLFSVLGAAVLWPAFALRDSHADASSVLTMFGAISALLAMVTLVPNRVGGYVSDGARLLMLWRKRPDGERWTALSAVAGLSLVERPKDWPAPMMEMLGVGKDSAPDAVYVCLLRHMWHADRREFAEAGMWLERGLANVTSLPKAGRGGMCAVAALYYARYGGDAKLARDYLDRATEPGLHHREDLHEATAAVLIAEGRNREALAELELAEVRLKIKPARLAAALRENLNELRAAIG
jgi:hypothetical protein